MNLDPGRQNFHNLTLIEVFVKTVSGQKQAHAKLRCVCGRTVQLSLSRWRTCPPSCCIKCSIKKNRIIGRGLRRMFAGDL